jgi:hypothetical protein
MQTKVGGTAGRTSVPRTPWGDPDLQGVWLNNSATPLERPKALEGKPTLTDDEVAELKRRAARIFDPSRNSDFAGGDNFFAAVLANPERYENSTTGSALGMIGREFDNRTSLILDPPDGKMPPMTREGRERLARSPAVNSVRQPVAGPEDISNAVRCITYGVPRVGTGNIAGAGPLGYYQIIQNQGQLALITEAIHDVRMVPLDGRPHLPVSIRQWNGDSRGRWDGDTLVIDTTNFSPLSNFFGAAEGLHLVEHFTRMSPSMLKYEITSTDPATWTKPWTVVLRLRQMHVPLYEYACHEGNYSLQSILHGARAEEKAATQAAKTGSK